MTVGSLFSGIGGFDLGFERAGFEITWQVEIDDYATRVLEKHWPSVRRYRDVRAVTGAELGTVDVVCGGFPCQPHSLAGRRKGAEDKRDLWPEFRRLIREVRPRWVVAENVPGLLSNDAGRFFGGILRDLAESGYDAEWDCIPALAAGLPHIRDRVWIVAYASGDGRKGRCEWSLVDCKDGAREGRQVRRAPVSACPLPNAEPRVFAQRGPAGRMGWTDGVQRHRDWEPASQPFVRRGVDGIPDRVDRLRGLGNAIVPQIAEWIARRILDAENLAVPAQAGDQ